MDAEEQDTGLTCAAILKTRFAVGTGARICSKTTTAKRSANYAEKTTSREIRSARQDTSYRSWLGDATESGGGRKMKRLKRSTTTTSTKKPEGVTILMRR
ncbi:hypothetical protein HPB50_016269 [Hyalomma asiaticum]|uniref:Uncharacterized protein n=1 Tax=Hyalomma asiaticum TaxID=266040 RepID=A0ACB7TA68_HYAAI|nr:hypothetical protein HPB50_016269 [Hyalomma asiaticum]